MTEKLQHLLHERAESVDFAVPDVAALTRAGDRRVRRRRGLAVGVAGGVAALVVVGAVTAVAQLGGPSHADRTPVAHDPLPTRAVSWASGYVIHEGGTSMRLDHVVDAYVQTSRGFVTVDPEGTVRSVVAGVETVVGRTDAKQPRLVSDPFGPRAAWVDRADRTEVEVVDQDAGTTRGFAAHGAAELETLDGDRVYVQDDRGSVVRDLADGTERVVAAGRPASGVREVVAAHDGTIAFGDDQGTRISTGPERGHLLDQAYGTVGAFSPDGRFYTSDADQPSVWDLTTWRQVAMSGLDGYGFATGYTWLDDDTLLTIAAKDPDTSPVELLTCRVPAGTCETVMHLARFQDASFLLPNGERMDG